MDNPGFEDGKDLKLSKKELNGKFEIGIEFENLEEIPQDFVTKCVLKIRGNLHRILWKGDGKFFIKFVKILAILLYNAFLIGAIIYNALEGHEFGCCNGIGFLVIITGIVYWSLFYYYIIKKTVRNKPELAEKLQNIGKIFGKIFNNKFVKGVILLGILAGIGCFIGFDMVRQPKRILSAVGIFVVIFVGFIFSKNPGHIKWKQIAFGIFLQFAFGLLVLRWDVGRSVLQCISEKVKTFVEFTYAGSDFIYGYLSSGKMMNDGTFLPPTLAFRSLSTLFFIGFIIQIAYHLGALQWLVVKLGWLLQISIGTTAVESMSVSANIFLSLVDVPLIIKPYLIDLTKSEFHACICGGFSTIAGAILAVYVEFGISASHLLTASVMAAPGALAMSKLFYPETKISRTTSKQIKSLKSDKQDQTLISAASDGAIQSLALIGSIIAICVAFLGFVSFLNAIIGWLGGLVGLPNVLSLEYLFGKIFVPVAYIMGIDSEEIDAVATLLGVKLILTDFVAFQRLSKLHLSPRSKAIATYALCSFANVAAVGVQLGILVALCPKRKEDIVSILSSAFLSAIATNILNACMAGTLMGEMGYAEWSLTANVTHYEFSTQSTLISH